MDLCGGGYGQYSESRRSDPEWAVVRMTIGAGQILSSRPRDCSPWFQPGSQRANHDEETTDGRSVCGRTARTVRRAGTAKAVSDPYQTLRGLEVAFMPQAAWELTQRDQSSRVARHFKKLRSTAFSMLTFCCMPFLANHWA